MGAMRQLFARDALKRRRSKKRYYSVSDRFKAAR